MNFTPGTAPRGNSAASSSSTASRRAAGHLLRPVGTCPSGDPAARPSMFPRRAAGHFLAKRAPHRASPLDGSGGAGARRTSLRRGSSVSHEQRDHRGRFAPGHRGMGGRPRGFAGMARMIAERTRDGRGRVRGLGVARPGCVTRPPRPRSHVARRQVLGKPAASLDISVSAAPSLPPERRTCRRRSGWRGSTRTRRSRSAPGATRDGGGRVAGAAARRGRARGARDCAGPSRGRGDPGRRARCAPRAAGRRGHVALRRRARGDAAGPPGLLCSDVGW